MRRDADKRVIQQAVPVKDRAAEVGINLNTIFTALVLAGIIWVGTTLESIRKTLNETIVHLTVVQHDIERLKKDWEKHSSDPNAHRKTAP